MRVRGIVRADAKRPQVQVLSLGPNPDVVRLRHIGISVLFGVTRLEKDGFAERQIATFRWTVAKPAFVPAQQLRRASLVTRTNEKPLKHWAFGGFSIFFCVEFFADFRRFSNSFSSR
jgi:hypothetical protein